MWRKVKEKQTCFISYKIVCDVGINPFNLLTKSSECHLHRQDHSSNDTSLPIKGFAERDNGPAQGETCVNRRKGDLIRHHSSI